MPDYSVLVQGHSLETYTVTADSPEKARELVECGDIEPTVAEVESIEVTSIVEIIDGGSDVKPIWRTNQ